MLNRISQPLTVSAGASSGSAPGLTFSNSNGVTFGLSSGTITASVATNYLTTAMASNRGTDFVQATAAFAGTNASGTINSTGISVSVGNYLTTARGSTDAIGLNTAKTNVTWTANSSGLSLDAGGYAGTGFSSTTTAGTAIVGTHNTAGLSVGVPAWLTTAMLSNAATISNVNLSAGTTSQNLSAFVLSNSNGMSFGLNGSTVTGSYTVPTQTNQSAIKGFGASNTGNTAGNTGLSTGIDWVLAGTNNVTISQSTVGGGPNTLWVSGAAAGVATAISGIVVSNTTYTSGTVSFSNLSNITISSSVNGATQYIQLSGNAAQTNQSAIKGFGVSNTGQTAGNTGLSTGIDWVLAGSNSITLSQSTAGGGPNTVWIQHPAWLTTAALSGDTTKYVQNWKLTGNTAGTTSSAQGTDLWLAGGNGITVSGSSNTISFSVGNYLTTARGSTDAIGLNTAKTNVTWTANSSGLSLDAGGYAGTVSGATNCSVTVNSAGVSVNLPAYLTTADLSGNSSNYFRNWKLTGNTAGTTSSQQGTDLWLAGGNNLTISGSSNSLSFSVGNYITTARSSNDAIGLNTAKTNVTWTANSSGLSLDASGYAGTVSGATNATITVNTAGVSVSVAAQTTQSAIKGWGASNTGNTAGNTGLSTGIDWVIAGTNNITVSQSTVGGGPNTIWLSAPNVAAGNVTISAGTSSAGLASVVFSNSNLVSFGLNGSTMTGSVPSTSSLSATGIVSISTNGSTISIGAGPMSFYATSNTTQSSSGTLDARSITFQGNGMLSVGVSNSSIVLSAPNVTTLSFFEPLLRGITSSQTMAIGSVYFQPFLISNNVSFNQLRFYKTNSTQQSTTASFSGSVSSSGTTSWQAAASYSTTMMLWSRVSTGTAANSSQIVSFYSTLNSYAVGFSASNTVSTNASSATVTQSTSMTLRFISQFDTAGGVTTASVGTSGSTSFSSTSNAQNSFSSSFAMTWASSALSGLRANFAPVATSLTPGEYWLAQIVGSTTATTNVNQPSLCVVSGGYLGYTTNTTGYLENGDTVTRASSGYFQGWGSYSASTQTSTTIPLSQVTNMSQFQTYFLLSNGSR